MSDPFISACLACDTDIIKENVGKCQLCQENYCPGHNSFGIEVIDLPKSTNYDLDIIQQLNHTYYTIIPKISITSEIAKREFLIAPLILEIAKLLPVKVNVEYPLDINDQLGGALDYLLKSNQNLIIIEAKKKDIDGGFNQLAAELIALDKYEESESIEVLYGAVTLGDIWKFGTLDRKRKHIAKTIQSQTIPRDTEEIFSILIGILSLKPGQSSIKR